MKKFNKEDEAVNYFFYKGNAEELRRLFGKPKFIGFDRNIPSGFSKADVREAVKKRYKF